MSIYSLSGEPDGTLLRDMPAFLAKEHAAAAVVLARLAEIDARKLYLPAGFSSMLAYCVEGLRLTEPSAKKRIRAGRAARRFPVIFEALADGRLHLSAVVMLSRYLTTENAGELLMAAAFKTKPEIDQVLAEWFPQLDAPPMVHPLGLGPRETTAPASSSSSSSCAPVSLADGAVGSQGAPGPLPIRQPRLGSLAASSPTGVSEVAPGPLGSRQSTVTPLAPQRFALQVTIDQRDHDNLRNAQALLGHQVPSGDVAAVISRALAVLVRHLERRKFAKTDRPRRQDRRQTTSRRHVPAAVRQAVWERDGGQCTFVGDSGHRRGSRALLEFDHVVPVARGGTATVETIRLRCRAHNQYEAERVFGAQFMEGKREAARQARHEARWKRAQAQRRRAEVETHPAAKESRARALAIQAKVDEVIPWLRRLGIRLEDARRAAACCERIAEAPLEERVRAALASHGRTLGGR